MNEWLWNIGGMILTGETGVLRVNESQFHFFGHRSHTDWSGIEPGPAL
jgi:hypothetical protein